MVEKIPVDLIAGPDNVYYGLFRISPGSRDTLNALFNYVATVDDNVEHTGEVSCLKLEEDLAVHRTENSMTVNNNWRFFKAFYQYDPLRDEVLYIENTSNEIIGIDSSGKEYVKGYLPFERFPVNREEMEQSLENVNYYYSGMENIVRRKLLAHEPCYWNVILDEDRLWVQLARSDKSKPNWVITSLDGEVLESFYGPDEITGVTIRGNRLYGVIKDPDGTTYLAGFELIGAENRDQNSTQVSACI